MERYRMDCRVARALWSKLNPIGTKYVINYRSTLIEHGPFRCRVKIWNRNIPYISVGQVKQQRKQWFIFDASQTWLYNRFVIELVELKDLKLDAIVGLHTRYRLARGISLFIIFFSIYSWLFSALVFSLLLLFSLFENCSHSEKLLMSRNTKCKT